jgi:Carboxylesterase family
MRAERCEKARANSSVIRGAFWALIGLATSMSLGTVGLSQSASVVRVDGGELQGVVAEGVVSFKGIPFAAPPVGDLRWRPPQPAAKWTGRAPGSGIRSGLHAGTVRSASGCGCARRCAPGPRHSYSRARFPTACDRARRSRSVGGLPVSERVASG